MKKLTDLLGIRYPIIAAPMAGGTTTPELIAAVSEAGGLGSLGAGYLSGEKITEQAEAIRALTTRPYAINLFVPGPCVRDDRRVAESNAVLDVFRDELGIERPGRIDQIAPDFEAQLEAAIAARPTMISTTFGMLGEAQVARIQKAGIRVGATATTVSEARAQAATGVDIITAQGFEAGGHRGSFLEPHAQSQIGLMALLPQMADAVNIPILASGGIMDGRGIAAALCLGAAGVQMGSAFLVTEESGAKPAHKTALSEASDEASVITPVFSGKPARGLYNRFIDTFEAAAPNLPDYPEQNAWTKDVRAAAGAAGEADLMSLWAGQAAGMARPIEAGELVRRLVRETDSLLATPL